MVKIRRSFLRISVLLFIIVAMAGCRGKQKEGAQAKNTKSMIQITDMAGRKVWIPRKVSTVFCSDEACTFFMYSLAPEKIIARNTACTEKEKPYTSVHFQKLPVLGRIFNGHSEVNAEELIRLKPDILLCPLFNFTTPEYIKGFEEVGALAGIPVVIISLDFEKLPDSYAFMGKLLDCKPQAEERMNYCRETLNWATSLRNKIKKPVTAYVAEGNNGLQTIPALSTHSETLRLAGVKNCATVDEAFGYKQMSIGFEQILNWNPDYIIVNSRSQSTKEEDLVHHIISDKLWSRLKAVQNKRIVITPNAPFNWIGRPPSINRLMGLQWLASTLYPELSDINLEQEVVRFYSLFYHLKLSKKQANTLISAEIIH